MSDLREAGWFHHDYVSGSKRPYNVTLHNYVVPRAHYFFKRNNHAVADGDSDEITLNPCDVKFCREIHRRCDGDERRGKSTNNHAQTPRGSSQGGRTPNSKATSKASEADTQVEDLVQSIYERTGILLTASERAVIYEAMQIYPAQELKPALQEYFIQTRTRTDRKTFFEEGGIRTVIDARRGRAEECRITTAMELYQEVLPAGGDKARTVDCIKAFVKAQMPLRFMKIAHERLGLKSGLRPAEGGGYQSDEMWTQRPKRYR
jgi:hypothetical protein